MAMEITNSYSSYAVQNAMGISSVRKAAKDLNADETLDVRTEKKGEAVKTYEAKETSKSSNKEKTEEYLKKLQKQVHSMKLESGMGLTIGRMKNVHTIVINPELLEKMQNDPELEKKYVQRLKDIERASNYAQAATKSFGHECVFDNWYIDENGNYTHAAMTVRKDILNEKLRKQAEKNVKELIEKTREKAAKKKEELKEVLEEKRQEKAADKEDTMVDGNSKEDKDVLSSTEKAERLLAEKMNESEDGIIFMDHDEVQIMIDGAKEDCAKKAAAKGQSAAGANVDVQA